MVKKKKFTKRISKKIFSKRKKAKRVKKQKTKNRKKKKSGFLGLLSDNCSNYKSCPEGTTINKGGKYKSKYVLNKKEKACCKFGPNHHSKDLKIYSKKALENMTDNDIREIWIDIKIKENNNLLKKINYEKNKNIKNILIRQYNIIDNLINRTRRDILESYKLDDTRRTEYIEEFIKMNKYNRSKKGAVEKWRRLKRKRLKNKKSVINKTFKYR